MTYSAKIELETRGHAHVVDISPNVRQALRDGPIANGIVCVFVVGSTAAITTTEAEPGLVNHDLKAFYERIAPQEHYYEHEHTWHDDNGHSHVRASSLGPSITVPLIDSALSLGPWQQIVLIDFDTRPRERTIIVQVVGDSDPS